MCSRSRWGSRPSEVIYFVADVHLQPGARDKERRFLRFLEAAGGDDVFILGDLFDYWVGARHYAREDFRSVLEALRRVPNLSFVPGNRDFLLDGRFTRRTGVRVLESEVRRTIGGRRVLMAHGDFVFNRNSKYFAYRRAMRSRFLTDSLQLLPGALAVRIARRYERVSKATTAPVRWTDEELVRASRPWLDGRADVLICGHIHHPRHLRFDRRELLVLGDWDGGGEYARFDGTDFSLQRWD